MPGRSSGTAQAHTEGRTGVQGLSALKRNLFDIQLFHTDRDSEFDNALIDELLESFQISRSLSMKGCPYDNAAAESTLKMIKAQFVSCRCFDTLDQLQLELADYMHWFNNIHLHGTLGYLITGAVQENLYLIISVQFGVDNPTRRIGTSL